MGYASQHSGSLLPGADLRFLLFPSRDASHTGDDELGDCDVRGDHDLCVHVLCCVWAQALRATRGPCQKRYLRQMRAVFEWCLDIGRLVDIGFMKALDDGLSMYRTQIETGDEPRSYYKDAPSLIGLVVLRHDS